MSRSLKKMPFFCINSVFERLSTNLKINSFFKARSSTIIPSFVGFVFEINNGCNSLKIKILDMMVGKKLGEFVNTRKYIFSKKKC
jgi:small subunit ribosomal protein S19